MGRVVSLLLLLPFLVEAQCQQTFPYISFMGKTLANHSYVDISVVGISASDSVQCHTDLSSCCSTIEGSHRGQWYFPNGTTLENSNQLDTYQHSLFQRVELHRNSGTTPSGIYRCEIQTNNNVGGETVYVGLYNTCDQGKYVILHFANSYNNSTRHAKISISE